MKTNSLIQFNRDVISQVTLVIKSLIEKLHQSPQTPKFGEYIGPHMRHILEHYEALLSAINSKDTKVYYDRRMRDRSVEQDQNKMQDRFNNVAFALQSWEDNILDKAVTTVLQGGLLGEHEFLCTSTVGRELMFLASHAIHHYALIQVYCMQHGISLVKDFGKAPSTVNHERSI